MENNTQIAKGVLPKLEDLYADKEISILNNELNKILNSQPKNEWLFAHPFATKKEKTNQGNLVDVPCVYLTVQRIEYLLTSIFLEWNLEVKDYKLLANSICVTVRLHYLNPVTNQWRFQDGIGAAPLQTDKGAGATDFNAIKSNAVQIGAPAAETFAFKDAAEKIGKLFGKDLNRADAVYYENVFAKFKVENEEADSYAASAKNVIDKAQEILNKKS